MLSGAASCTHDGQSWCPSSCGTQQPVTWGALPHGARVPFVAGNASPVLLGRIAARFRSHRGAYQRRYELRYACLHAGRYVIGYVSCMVLDM